MALRPAKADGAFALDWEAHGLKYALPRSIEDEVAAGRVVVANGSRRMVAEALARYPDAQILLIDAPPEVRAGRLARRGRETVAAMSERLAREALLPVGIAVTTIDNSGTIETALDAFISAISPARVNFPGGGALFALKRGLWTVMTRNGLYGLVGVLALVVVILAGYMIYQQQTQPKLEIRLDGDGLQVNGNG